MRGSRIVQSLVAGAALGFTVVATLFLVSNLRSPSVPEQVAEAFFLQTYTHDFSAAWERISRPDQAARSRDEYLEANPPVSDLQAALYKQLAKWGEFQAIAVVSNNPNQAIVTARIRYPNSGQSSVEELVAAAGKPDADSAALLQEMNRLYESDQLQFVEGEVSFDLVLERYRWRIVQHWRD